MERTPQVKVQEAYELFGQYRCEQDPELKQLLAQELLGHDAIRERVFVAIDRICPQPPRDLQFWEDVPQEAFLLLALRFPADALKYRDHGVGHFSGWLWALCLSAASRALEHWQSSRRSKSTRAVDPENLKRVQARPVGEHRHDIVLRVVAKLDNPKHSFVLLQLFSSVEIEETARRLDVSVRQVRRLRIEAGEEFFKRFEEELRDS